MKLTVFNGSPRGQKSNTCLLLEQFLQGFNQSGEHSVELFYLNRTAEQAQFAKAFEEAEAVLLAFPLYTDSMPGVVKAFIESLEPYCGRPNNPPIGFIIQSGFPEALHSRHVEKYVRRLAQRLGCEYLGAAVRGGVEGIQIQPPSMTKKLFRYFYDLGAGFARTRTFDPQMIKKMAGTEHFPPGAVMFIKLFQGTDLFNGYWISQLKSNSAYERRNARPYEK